MDQFKFWLDKYKWPLMALLGIIAAADLIWTTKRYQSSPPLPVAKTPAKPVEPVSTEAPKLTTSVLISGLTNPWDIGFAPSGEMIFTERPGRINVYRAGQKQLLAAPSDVIAVFEGGMLGLAIDPDFKTNRYLYTCFNSTAAGRDVRLVRWMVKPDWTGLTDRRDIITGMPMNTGADAGRHSGCRPRFGPDGNLWVGAGDAAIGANPQSPTSLGGKVLRVDRDGKGVSGNLVAPFDNRIYSYGHRNLQGLAFLAKGNRSIGYSIEHGSDVDDEINLLKPGNFGWDPLPGYNESVPMTDKTKYPNAIEAIWRSGRPTIAPSGGVILTGRTWKGYEGALAMAVLKGQQLRIIKFDAGNKIIREEATVTDQGRLRSAVQGPDGKLYISTDNGKATDKILVVTPS